MNTVYQPPFKYDHRLFIYFLYPFISLAIVHIANDNSFQFLLSTPSYYTDILFSCMATYFCGWVTRISIEYLDSRISWSKTFNKRLLYQSGCMLLLIVFIGLAEILYLQLIGISWRKSSMLYYELPIAGVFLVLINLIYYIMYLQQTPQAVSNPAVSGEITPTDDLAVDKVFKQELAQHNLINSIQTEPAKIDYFVVSVGDKEIALDLSTIAIFFIEDKHVFLRTLTDQTYLVNENLEKILTRLDTTVFYRINRQVILNRAVIASVERTLTRKLILQLKVTFCKQVFISKANATQFLTWWSG